MQLLISACHRLHKGNLRRLTARFTSRSGVGDTYSRSINTYLHKTYSPQDGHGMRGKVSEEQTMVLICLHPACHYLHRTYSPQDGRGMKGKISEEQAMSELVDVVKNLRPDNFEPRIIKQDKDYLYVEYQSPTFGVGGFLAACAMHG
eukprot:1148771-Pelagomonas_calceolata.AAC.1